MELLAKTGRHRVAEENNETAHYKTGGTDGEGQRISPCNPSQ